MGLTCLNRALSALHLLNKRGPCVLLLLPLWMKIGAQDVAVESKLPHAEPKDVAGLLMRRDTRVVAARRIR